MSGPVPLTVLSGFLGSGKTTLLRRALGAHDATGTAVIVNELGEVGLDQLQVSHVADRTVLLANGCLCCATREDVAETLRALLETAEATGHPLARVVLETSGLADPGPILTTVRSDRVLRHRFAVDRVVVTCDAEHAATHQALPEWHAQLAAADMVAVTKADRAGPGRAAGARVLASTRCPAAEVVDAATVDLLALGPASTRPPVRHDGGHRHATGVSTASVVVARRVAPAPAAVWLSALLHAHGPEILRIKALLDTGDAGPLVLDTVQHAVYPPRHLAAWPSPRASSLVAITRGLDAQRVVDSFVAFLVDC